MCIISKNIPIDANGVIKEIKKRQSCPWNNGRINEYNEFPLLMALYERINSNIPKEDFFYKGPIYRIHTSYTKLVDDIDTNQEFLSGEVNIDGSCSVLPITQESQKLCSFSKKFDFTSGFAKILEDETAIFLHCDTGSLYGIDVSALLNRFNIYNRFQDEQEILFPIYKKHIIKEYKCSPKQFNYHMRHVR